MGVLRPLFVGKYSPKHVSADPSTLSLDSSSLELALLPRASLRLSSESVWILFGPCLFLSVPDSTCICSRLNLHWLLTPSSPVLDIGNYVRFWFDGSCHDAVVADTANFPCRRLLTRWEVDGS